MIKEVFDNPGYTVDLEKGIIYGLRGQQLIPCKTHNGYYTVTVQNKRKKVHRLVLMTATQNKGEGMQVNHKDGNKANNKISNLEWVTPYENTKHAEQNKLRSHTPTKTRKDRKLSDGEVILIRRCLAKGMTTSEIKKICPKADAKNIYSIKNNICYKLVKDNTEVNY